MRVKIERVSKARQAIYAHQNMPPIAQSARLLIHPIRIVGPASRLPSAPLTLKLSTAGEQPSRAGATPAPLAESGWSTRGEHGIGRVLVRGNHGADTDPFARSSLALR